MALLTEHHQVTILSEVVLTIDNFLMGDPKDEGKTMTDIVSHPQPLMQCANYLHQHFPNVTLHHAFSTAQAVEMMKKIQEKSDTRIVSVIGSDAIAQVFNLKIWDKYINDKPNNTTRFLIISKKGATAPTGHDKTSLIFSTAKDTSGGLYDALGSFAKRDINLSMITSQPTRNALGEYVFFIDCEGHCQDKDVKNALEDIQAQSLFFKFLGSYKRETP